MDILPFVGLHPGSGARCVVALALQTEGTDDTSLVGSQASDIPARFRAPSRRLQSEGQHPLIVFTTYPFQRVSRSLTFCFQTRPSPAPLAATWLDPSMVINPRCLHLTGLTLGIMTLALSPPLPSKHDRDDRRRMRHDTPRQLPPRIRAVLVNNPLQILLSRQVMMQLVPAHVHTCGIIYTLWTVPVCARSMVHSLIFFKKNSLFLWPAL